MFSRTAAGTVNQTIQRDGVFWHCRSPEVAEQLEPGSEAAVGRAADVWPLAAISFQILSTHAPFAGKTGAKALEALRNKQPPFACGVQLDHPALPALSQLFKASFSLDSAERPGLPAIRLVWPTSAFSLQRHIAKQPKKCCIPCTLFLSHCCAQLSYLSCLLDLSSVLLDGYHVLRVASRHCKK